MVGQSLCGGQERPLHGEARSMGYLLRGAANRLWSHTKREKVLRSEKLGGMREMKCYLIP